MKSYRRCVSFSVISLFVFNFAAAQTEIRFNNAELAAAATLMRPELNSIEIEGRKGVFVPAPSLQFLKVDPVQFEIDPSFITDLVKLEFNHLKADSPKVFFTGQYLQVDIPIQDQRDAIQSRLGSISFSGVVASAQIGWRERDDGNQELYMMTPKLSGNITGTGILDSKLVLNELKKLFMKVLADQVETLLSKENVRDSIQSALLYWAKFYSGINYTAIEPGSIEFYNEGAETGLKFSAEK